MLYDTWQHGQAVDNGQYDNRKHVNGQYGNRQHDNEQQDKGQHANGEIGNGKRGNAGSTSNTGASRAQDAIKQEQQQQAAAARIPLEPHQLQQQQQEKEEEAVRAMIEVEDKEDRGGKVMFSYAVLTTGAAPRLRWLHERCG